MVTVENAWVEVEESGADTVIIPIGAIEQHGPHLPLGTDWFAADRVGKAIGEELNAYVLPALAVSNSQERLDFRGSVSLRPSTLALVLEDTILSLAHQGFRKFVVANCHGGNWVVKPTIRDINFRHPEPMVIMHTGALPGETSAIPPEIHAGAGETTAMAATRPELVKEEAEDFTPQYGREYLDYVGMRAVSPTGVWGNPSEAEPEGYGPQSYVKRSVEYITATFAELERLKHSGY